MTVAERSAQVLASAVTVARQLHGALTRRAVIDQAIGIVRAHTGLGAEEAFAQRRVLGRTPTITLVEESQRIVDDAIAGADT